MILLLSLCLAIGIGLFIYDAGKSYEIDSRFESIPLQFNPDDSSSVYKIEDGEIKIYGGFVKGRQKEKNQTYSIVLRALSPLPKIEVKKITHPVDLILENVNPDFYIKHIHDNDIAFEKVAVNTLRIHLTADELKEPFDVTPGAIQKEESLKFVILGDNRDGYTMFKEIIQQINGIKPVFIIDNGDLVFSGKANQYRLFDKITSQLGTTFLTTLGNHDIRGNGRGTYEKLYGPSYFAFDFLETHFIFLDSSPGWANKTAISEEQYIWLEKDLKKSVAKRNFVVTHIPPYDPREGTVENEIPNYMDQLDNNKNWVENKLNDYSASKSMDHGFQDPEEAAKFESLMSQYHVDTVYLSHIHSYLEYTIDGVRYIITGGAGAELLTKDSYYHYLIADFADPDRLLMVEMPSPANNLISRYSATFQLFALAMYRENPLAVTLILTGAILLIVLILLKVIMWNRRMIIEIAKWLINVGRYAIKEFRVHFSK